MDDPAVFSRAFLGKKLWAGQRSIIRALRDGDVAVRSGHAIGKTTIGAVAACFWMMRPDSIVITVAPSMRQVKSQIWREIRSSIQNARSRVIQLPSGLRMATYPEFPQGQAHWTVAEKWYALGVSTNEPEKLAGAHSKRVLVIIDEASGVDDRVWEVADAVLTGKHDRKLVIGNPTRTVGKFREIWSRKQEAGVWQRFHFDCTKLPWIESRQDPPVEGLVTHEWVDKMRAKWGPHSPIFKIRVRGEFSTTDENVLLTVDQIEAASRVEGTRGRPVSLGVDVARYGEDKTVLTWIEGNAQVRQWAFDQRDTVQVAEIIRRAVASLPVDCIGVDADGIGAGVCDNLKRLGVAHYEFHGGEKPDRPQYRNLRTESHWNLAESIRGGHFQIIGEGEPYADELHGQLAFCLSTLTGFTIESACGVNRT